MASSTVAAGVLLVAAGADAAGALRACKRPCAALLALRYGRAVGLVSIRARWGLWDPWGRRTELGTFSSRFWTCIDEVVAHWTCYVYVGHVWIRVGHVIRLVDMYR